MRPGPAGSDGQARAGWREAASRDAAMQQLLSAGGTMGALIGGHDWPSSRLGAVAGWPQSLRSALGICLSSRFPMFVFWGPDLVQLYNDSFVPVLGAKHPGALGQAARDTWAETWDVVGPMLGRVMAGGDAAYFEDLPVTLERSGFTEECYFTFCYSPVRDESGGVAGVFGTVSETTTQVVEGRRLAVLAELSELTRTLGSAAAVCQVAGEVLARHPLEVPFALLYQLDADGERAVLAGSAGLAPGTSLSPPVASLRAPGPAAGFSWPLARARAGPVEITGLPRQPLEAVSRAGFAPPASAILMPLAQAGASTPAAVLIIGLGSGRPLDDGYRTFARLAAGHLSAAIADATALEAARGHAAELEALDRAKTMFFSNVSHELRTPLTLMLAPLEDLLASPEGLRPADRDRVEIAHRSSLRLLRQVNVLLDFSRAQDAAGVPRPQLVDLAQLTEELASLFQVAMERGGLRLVLDCPPLPRPVSVDEGMWEQVIVNLLSNAFKFTLHGEITVTVDTCGEQARIRVSDTGSGIPPADLPHLFDRFYQVAGTAARSGEGSGIGLSLARELVQRHNGTISVTSAVGAGSTFTVLLPFGEAQPDLPVSSAAQAAGTRAAGYVQEALGWEPAAPGPVASGPPEILIVDDNADMRGYLARALAPYWQVQAVSDGLEALDAIARQAPELVLTDVMMPRLDGFGLLSRLRSAPLTADIPVIMLSARAGPESVSAGLDTGADDYLVKPFTTAELTARVRTQLRTARQRRRSLDRVQALAESTRQLNASLDPREISQALTQALVPRFAGNCAVQLPADAGPAPLHRTAPDAGAPAPGQAPRPDRVPGPLVLPLTCRGHHVGTVTLTGLTPAALDPDEHVFLTELASRAAVALDNAARYQHERGTAMSLQAAMLTDLPEIPGLDSAAVYRPAAVQDLVGGDWYDSFPIPREPGAGTPVTSLAIAIGDITGHDLHAATIMGQVRSMLRQAVFDYPARGPHAAVSAMEHACLALPVSATGTLVLARLDNAAGTWTLTWTNAGHPPPLLCHPDGTVRTLDQHDLMFYPGFDDPPRPRTEHRQQIPPGSTILLYTDGLVDRPGGHYDHDLDLAAAILAAHRDLPLDQLLNSLADRIAGPDHPDDIALLAVRIR
jgi:signal transduction histidine kinase/CheY-like chemotaxis protein/serine phosphatase RsbU (regulator of sigma subunit)